MTKEFELLMSTHLRELNLELDQNKMEQFFQYYSLLIEWNKVMNLTAIIEMNEVVVKHFIDSLSLIKAFDGISEELLLIDVGTGAGFPGIPLKIAFPNLKITLLDSLNKRIDFLSTVVEKLELKDVKLIHGRAEDFGRDVKYREQYDICVSRAVANFSTLSEYCLPFVKVGGFFIPYKAGKLKEELIQGKGAVQKLGSQIQDIFSFTLPNTDMERSLVKVKKHSILSKKYPRKAGIPSKEPL